jgi:hypothetical protein
MIVKPFWGIIQTWQGSNIDNVLCVCDFVMVDVKITQAGGVEGSNRQLINLNQ